MPALDGALTLPEVDERAVRVAEDLDLDVARCRDVPFQEDAVVSESRGRLPARRCDGVVELVG